MASRLAARRVVTVFETDLGWIALLGEGNALVRLTLGHPAADDALASLGPWQVDGAQLGRWNPSVVKRLQAYARGAADDFRDVRIAAPDPTPFQRRVLAACRRVGFGKTATYAALADAAGAPRAARAVGTVMSKNVVPIIIPCHRVVAADGLGGYNCPRGVSMKKQLLSLEARGLAQQSAARKRPVRAR